MAARTKSGDAQVMVDVHKKIGASRLQIGVTHTQYSLDTGGDAAAIARAKKLLQDAGVKFHNVHIMGWGTMNPQPAPDKYDWQSLDQRMEMVRSFPGAVPVITLCGCPDWMKGGEPGKTDWKKLESAPLPPHFPDFARLARTIAERYPYVRHFQVWNEMKGLWDAKNNNWNFRAYTDLYNQVYAALKAANGRNQVGGPYLVVEGTGGGKGPQNDATNPPLSPRNLAVIDYWLQNKKGAEFLTLDRGLTSFHDKNIYMPEENMALTHWFGDIGAQVMKRPGAQNLPFWWVEFYAGRCGAEVQEAAARTALAYRSALIGGASVILLWQPMNTGEVGHSLFTDVRKPNGGQPLPVFEVVRAFNTAFAPGTPLVASQSDAPHIQTLASPRHVLVINKQADPATVLVQNRTQSLPGYGVALIPTV